MSAEPVADPREKTYRDASFATAFVLAIASLAAIFLPFENGSSARSVFAAAREVSGDPNRVIGLLVVAAAPLLLALATLAASRGDGPSLPLRIVTLVLTFPMVAIPAVGAALDAMDRRRFFHAPLLYEVIAYGGTVLGLVAFARAMRGGRWKSWAHAIVAPSLGAVALVGFVLAQESVYSRARLVGWGANVFLAAAGAFVPIALFVMLPRRGKG